MKYLSWNVGGLPKEKKMSHAYRVLMKRRRELSLMRNRKEVLRHG